MASSKEYLDFVLEQLSELDDISYKAMMGEYIIYYRGKIVGGVYDDRFLVKPVKTAKNMMPEAELELPYEGLWMPHGIWHDMKDFAPETVLLVFASDFYDPADYIRDYDEFLQLVKEGAYEN